MAVKYKLIVSVVGAAVASAGITTPLVVNATSKSEPLHFIESKASTNPVNKIVSEELEKVEVVSENQSHNSSSIVQVEARSSEGIINEEGGEKDIYLGNMSIDDEVNKEDWQEALDLIREARQNRNNYQQKRLSSKHREALKERYDYFSNLDSDSWEKSYSIRSDLQKLNWSEEKLKLVENPDNKDHWGWGSWEKENPFRHFYQTIGENSWKEKVIEYESNQKQDDSNENSQIESSIELDIADWLLAEMERIYKKIWHTL